MSNRMFIDLLGVEKGKAFGYQEYIFNLLRFFYDHRDDLLFNEICLWCKKTELSLFAQFEDRFVVQGFDFSSYFKRHWLQTILPLKYNLANNDLLFSPGNTSGLINRGVEVLTIHDLLYKHKEWIPSRLMRLQREILVPTSIRKATRIVAISNFTKEEIEKYYPFAKGKIVVIHNSFNFEKYEIKSEKQSPENTDFFLGISTNADYKNQKTILQAFRIYCENGGKRNLFFVGRINEGSESATYYFQLPHSVKERIMWKSNITNEELGCLYRNAACFISASKFEGLGMPVVEAMSFGLPVLLSDIPPHREVSLNMGAYFAPSNYKQLSLMMLNNVFEKREYGKEIRNVFSERNTSAKYVALFNELFIQNE